MKRSKRSPIPPLSMNSTYLVNEKDPNENTGVNIEELEKFVEEVKVAFIAAMREPESAYHDIILSGESTEAQDYITQEGRVLDRMINNCKLLNKKVNELENEIFHEGNNQEKCIDNEENVETIIRVNGELKINKPKDPETMELWKLLLSVIDQPIEDEVNEDTNPDDLLEVSKFGEDADAFFKSLQKH